MYRTQSEPTNKLTLDADGAEYVIRGSHSKNGKVYVSRNGRLITKKELRRRELQSGKDLGIIHVNTRKKQSVTQLVPKGKDSLLKTLANAVCVAYKFLRGG